MAFSTWVFATIPAFVTARTAAEPSPATTSGTPAAGDTAVASDTATVGSAASTSAEPPQRDVIDVLHAVLHKKVEPQLGGNLTPGLSWSILPSLSYNPVYGWAIGASLSGAGKRGNDPAGRPSAVALSGNYSTTGQLQLQVKGDVNSRSSDYLLRADVRYLDTKRSTWGLGPIADGQEEYPMEFNLVRFYATMYRRTGGPVYVGFGYHQDDYSDIVDDRARQGEATPFTVYSRGAPTHTRAAGISLNLLGDTRDNLVNPTRGIFLSGSFRDYVEGLGSDKNWQELLTDVRIYPHIPGGSHNVLAFWITSWLTFGPAPYLDLPAIGWDTYGRGGRGYLQGRIRGQNQIYVETEYRMQLTRDGLLGAVVFLNIMATTVPETNTFGQADKGGGLGLRLKFNKRSSTNLTLDRGWGEAGSKGWFMGMTEVF